MSTHVRSSMYFQVCTELDWYPRGSIWEGKPSNSVWQVCTTVPWYNETQIQEDHSNCRDQPCTDVVLFTGMSPSTRKHTTRLSKGVIWALLCLCYSLGVWWMYLPRSGIEITYAPIMTAAEDFVISWKLRHFMWSVCWHFKSFWFLKTRTDFEYIVWRYFLWCFKC